MTERDPKVPGLATAMVRPGEQPRPWFKLAMVSWAAWLVILLGALALEEVPRDVFSKKAAVAVYLTLQGSTHLVALVACGMTLLRGPNRLRLMVILPALILVGYTVVFIMGPG